MAIECQNHIQPRTKGPTQAYASGVMGALFIEREKLVAILALQLASSAPRVFAYGSAKLSRSNETLCGLVYQGYSIAKLTRSSHFQ